MFENVKYWTHTKTTELSEIEMKHNARRSFGACYTTRTRSWGVVDTVSTAVRGSNGKRNRMMGCNHREHSSWVKRVDVIVKQEIVRPYLDYRVRFGNLI